MKAIILDMYGVIVKQTGDDFVPYVQQTFPNLKPEEICTPWFKADVGELTSLQVWEALGYIGDIEEIEKQYLDTIELSEGFIEFISLAKEKYKLAIISNDSSRWSKYLREKFDIEKYFNVISISGDLKTQKPDKHIFNLTLKQLDCIPTECYYIDDRESNIKVAQNLGMQTILFNRTNIKFDGKTVSSFKDLKYLL